MKKISKGFRLDEIANFRLADLSNQLHYSQTEILEYLISALYSESLEEYNGRDNGFPRILEMFRERYEYIKKEYE